MPATIVPMGSATGTFPPFIVFDASVLLSLNPTHSGRTHLVIAGFLNRIRNEVAAGRVFAVVPLLALEECYFHICKAELQRITPTGLQWTAYLKRNPSALNGAIPHLAAFDTCIKSFPFFVLDPDDLSIRGATPTPKLADRLLAIICSHRILPKDAALIAEAERLGATGLASADGDWATATGFTLFTP